MTWLTEATGIALREGPHDGERLDLLPRKHKQLTMPDGSTYFRMDKVRSGDRPDGGFDLCYLWTDYWKNRLARTDDGAA